MCRFIKGLAVGKVPGHGVKALGTVAAAARHKQAGAHPRAVGDITKFDVGIIQGCIFLPPQGTISCRSRPASSTICFNSPQYTSPRSEKQARGPQPFQRCCALLKKLPILAKNPLRNSSHSLFHRM